MKGVFEVSSTRQSEMGKLKMSFIVVKFWETEMFGYLVVINGDEDFQSVLVGAEVWEYCSSEDNAKNLARSLNKR